MTISEMVSVQCLQKVWVVLKKIYLRDVPVEEQARKIKPLDGRFFSNFVGNKNSIRLSALKDLRLTEPKTLIKKRIKVYKISCCNNKTHLLEENLLPL